MLDQPDTTTPIQSRYAEQFAADLKNNREEQEAISAQIAELEARLTQLKADETWLAGQLASADTQQAPHSGNEAHQTAQSTGPTSEDTATPRNLPTQRQGTTSTKGAAGTPSRSKKKTAAKKATAKKVPAEKPTQPLLQDVILSLLRAHPDEPRTAREVHTALETAGRASSQQATRNTLERLVAKRFVERERRQGSVMYTAITPEEDPQSPADAPAAPEGEDVSETVAAEA